jgi:hypothetical protein
MFKGNELDLLLPDDLATETPVESDERFFVLKPYVFGAHKVRFFHLLLTSPLT